MFILPFAEQLAAAFSGVCEWWGCVVGKGDRREKNGGLSVICTSLTVFL